MIIKVYNPDDWAELWETEELEILSEDDETFTVKKPYKRAEEIAKYNEILEQAKKMREKRENDASKER